MAACRVHDNPTPCLHHCVCLVTLKDGAWLVLVNSQRDGVGGRLLYIQAVFWPVSIICQITDQSLPETKFVQIGATLQRIVHIWGFDRVWADGFSVLSFRPWQSCNGSNHLDIQPATKNLYINSLTAKSCSGGGGKLPLGRLFAS